MTRSNSLQVFLSCCLMLSKVSWSSCSRSWRPGESMTKKKMSPWLNPYPLTSWVDDFSLSPSLDTGFPTRPLTRDDFPEPVLPVIKIFRGFLFFILLLSIFCIRACSYSYEDKNYIIAYSNNYEVKFHNYHFKKIREGGKK